MLDANRGVNWGAGGGTWDVASGATLTYAGITVGNSASGTTFKIGTGTLDMSGAAGASGGLTISAGTLIAPTAAIFDVNGDLTNNSGSGALVTGIGTVTLSRAGGSQAIAGSHPIAFNGLTISNPSGVTAGYDVAVAGTLTLTNGNITTGSYVVDIGATGSVSRTSGHIVGNLRKPVATGSPSVTFEIGDASQYTPVDIAFANVTVAGSVTASTTSGDHASLATSAIDPTASVNRFWTLSNGAVTFSDANITFNYAAADIDAGADTSDFGVARYAAASWQTQTTLSQGATSTTASGITSLGDFAVGELGAGALDHFIVSAPATTPAGSAFDVTVTAVDAVGNRLGSYIGTISFSSTDPHASFIPSTYAFQVADHGLKPFAPARA